MARRDAAEDSMIVTFKRFATVVLLAFGLACGGGTDAVDALDPDLLDVSPDVIADIPADVPVADAPDAVEVAPDAPACTDGEASCAGAYLAKVCQGQAFVDVDCMATQGRVCENGACVEPWKYGAPVWTTCPGVEGGTTETLAQKAAGYDAIASRLHIHPDLKVLLSATLKKVETACVGDATPPCYATPDPTTATYEDVGAWHTGENDGLWSALYLTSQAFRYGTTKSPEALAIIRTLLEGEVTRMKVTGVPGLFTRQFIPPNVAGIACPDPVANKALYTTDVEKDDNRWVQVRDDGCVWSVNRVTLEWEGSTHCGLDAYKGWCWLDNVSQDEYAGHTLALGALYKLVDVPDVQAIVKDLMTQVADHLVKNDLYFVDWDGRQTEHGKLHAYSFADTPGFLSTMSMDYILMGAVASGREDLRRYYDQCLNQNPQQCEGWAYPDEPPYKDLMSQMWLYLGNEGCGSNYNNFSMVYTSLHNLIWFENDAGVREAVQKAFDENFMREADQPRALIVQQNPWFNFGWAAFKRLGQGSDGPATQAVDEGICSLKQFPAVKMPVALDPASKYPHYCDQRNDGSATEFPVPVNERCISTFEWWSDPYDRDTCGADPWTVIIPGDYLLPYWMGRYFGFIPETL
jgi:hypothetical protein